MSTGSTVLDARPLWRTRSVDRVGKLTGAYFAVRGAVVWFCVRFLHLQPSTGAAISLSLGLILLLLLGFHSVGAAKSVGANVKPVSLWRNAVVRWVAAYLGFAGASLLWGVQVSVLSSAAYWCALLLDAVTLLLLLALYAPQDVAKSVLSGYLLGACAIAALAWMMPTPPDLRLGDPEFFNTNQIANVCAFGVFFAQYLERLNTRKMWVPIFLLSVTLLRTLSKTTLIAFLLGQCVLLFRDANILAQTRRRVLLCVVVVLIASSGLLVAYYDVYTRAGNQADTFTGRTAIWAWASEKIPESPWIGHGFDSMWKVMPPFGPDRFEARHAENELLQQLYAYGLLGASLFCAVYFSLFRAVRKSTSKNTSLLLKVLMLFVLVRGLAEAEPFDLLLPMWVILLLASSTVQVIGPGIFGRRLTFQLVPKNRGRSEMLGPSKAALHEQSNGT